MQDQECPCREPIVQLKGGIVKPGEEEGRKTVREKCSKQKEECVLYNPIYMNLRKEKQKDSDRNQNSDYDRLGC